jgi:hypothetical protein
MDRKYGVGANSVYSMVSSSSALTPTVSHSITGAGSSPSSGVEVPRKYASAPAITSMRTSAEPEAFCASRIYFAAASKSGAVTSATTSPAPSTHLTPSRR